MVAVASPPRPSIPPSHPLPSASTLRQVLLDSIGRHAARAAILSPGRGELTYAALGDRLQAVADSLADAGLGRGHRIAVALPHGPEFAVALLAVCCSATCLPLNEQLTEDAIAQLLTAMRADALIAPADADTAAARAARRVRLPVLGLRAEPQAAAGSFVLQVPQRVERWPQLPPAPEDVALVAHTSGTTGQPKILPFTHQLLVESACRRVQIASIEPSDRLLSVLPYYSSVAIRRGLLPLLIVGGAIVCPPALDAATLVAALETLRPTQFMAPPVMQIALLEEYERRTPPPSHALRFITSSFTELDLDMRTRLERAFGVPVVVTYGMAECGSIAETPLPPRTAPPDSVGRPTLLEVAIADDAGCWLGADETGEIVVRGPEVIAGYENDPAANAAAFRDGWFRTGDAGRIDRDGFVFLVGRLKDLINRGGNKIAPAEIEDALRRHPKVADAAAFAVPHPTLGEDALAAVEQRDPAIGEGELRRFLRSRLAAFKMPSRILPLPSLPRGALGKVSRSDLARLAREALAAGFEPPQGAAEAEVARIFADVLELPSVGRTDNFFQLGGDSLNAVRVLAAVESTFGVRLELDTLFDHPSVAEFAAAVRPGRPPLPEATAADGDHGKSTQPENTT